MKRYLLQACACLIFLCWLPLNAGPRPPQQLAGLIASADAIAVVEIGRTDYSRTPADGPMSAEAVVVKPLKGNLRQGQSFSFSESAWFGPEYKSGEVRLLFLESGNGGAWYSAGNTLARPSFFVEREAIPRLSLQTLRTLLESLPAVSTRTVFRITPEVLR